MKVNEIFLSWQGEGYHTGMPAVFVRFAGCNLNCSFCDTDYSKKTEMTTEEIRNEVLKLTNDNSVNSVILTGGEPLLQKGINLLIDKLGDRFFNIYIETNGTLFKQNVVYCWVTCSPKKGTELNPKLQKQVSEYKYIIEHDSVINLIDGLPEGLPRKIDTSMFRPLPRIFVQPCDYKDKHLNNIALKKAMQISKDYGYRLSVQMHKLIGIK